jgi:chloramphenicol 3-O-phosphotransferase
VVEVWIGPGGISLLAGVYHEIAALAASGIEAIVADVIHDRRVLNGLSASQAG